MAWVVLAVVACAWATTVMVLSIAAYLAPAVGLALVFGGVGPVAWSTRVRTASSPSS